LFPNEYVHNSRNFKKSKLVFSNLKLQHFDDDDCQKEITSRSISAFLKVIEDRGSTG
jgi:hypothetical protein